MRACVHSSNRNCRFRRFRSRARKRWGSSISAGVKGCRRFFIEGGLRIESRTRKEDEMIVGVGSFVLILERIGIDIGAGYNVLGKAVFF